MNNVNVNVNMNNNVNINIITTVVTTVVSNTITILQNGPGGHNHHHERQYSLDDILAQSWHSYPAWI
jgi:hypothetical protein